MTDFDIDNIGYLKSSEIAANKSASLESKVEAGAFSLTPDYQAFRNTWFGQPQPVSYKVIWKAYLEEPIVRACVDITVDAIIGDGYEFEGSSELHVKKVRKVFEDSGSQRFLSDLVTSLVLFGDSYIEPLRDPSGIVYYMRPVDTPSIRIDYDQNGNVVQYVQRVLHRRVNFYPDEMIHFTINNVGGRVYGSSFPQAILFTLQGKLAAQNFNTEYFRRPGLPRSIYISKNISDEQNKRIVANLKAATPQTDLWINSQGGEITHSMVSPNNQDMQFIELMNYLRQEIIAASGVPPIFLGITEGSNRSNSQTQMESWDRKKKKMRLAIQDIINMNILTVANFGFSDVRFRFKDENSRERLKYGQLAQLLSSVPYVTPNQLLDIAGFPSLEDDKIRYDSTTQEFDHKTDEVGDTPIYLLQQQQAQAQMEQQAAMGIGKKPNMNNPNAANPMRNQDKKDNAERLNSEQANETRQNKMAKSDPRKDNPFGAVPVEPEVLDQRNWKLKEDWVKEIVKRQVEAMRNLNPEYDNKKSPAGEAANYEHPTGLPPAIGTKSVSDKAIFYKGTTQLDEMNSG